MFNKTTLTLLVLFLSTIGYAQDCEFSLSGTVSDSDIDSTLELVSVYIKEAQKGTSTDENGFFELNSLCEGSYHIVFSHIGCESKQVFIQLTNDMTLDAVMEHSINALGNVIVKGKSVASTTQNIETINEQHITDNANENLSNLLEELSGVSTVKNGNGIAKPVVQGLFGNRLTILNNGVPQSGQQWGNDHSPEIDPLVANNIKVIKGTSALEYMGSNLGSVILVSPKKIEKEPHLHGKSTYFFETNGFGTGLNLQLQQYSPKIAWKVNGTVKRSGDKRAPDYYLNNTGSQEANLALQLEKSFNDNWFSEVYLSTFNTELGVLRGAQIGNITDLEAAFQREEPFFTEDNFSYGINAPKQEINHHLLKIHTKYNVDDSQGIDITLAGQLNNRKEFDVRRSGRTEIPSLSLLQYSLFVEGKYIKKFADNLNLKSGIQFNYIDNTNDAVTGVLPLIPDYTSIELGAFVIVNKRFEKSFYEIGLRYDNTFQNVATITRTVPREIERFNNVFHNFSGSVGWNYSLNETVSFLSNVGYASRNPAINELYSNGLHQGVSGVEVGNIALKTAEKALKGNLGVKVNTEEKISFESLFYYQRINDYIYLDPQEEIRVTIRGAFPVFGYEQTDAEIFGVDFTGKYQFNKSIHAKATYSFIRGNDLTDNIPLVFIPANNFLGSVKYEFSNPIKIGRKQLENVSIEVNDRYVFEQDNLLETQDFLPPPSAYNLVGINMAADLQLSSSRLRITAKVDNLLNVSYRDYLNRQRYFADDLGVSASLGVSVKF